MARQRFIRDTTHFRRIFQNQGGTKSHPDEYFTEVRAIADVFGTALLKEVQNDASGATGNIEVFTSGNVVPANTLRLVLAASTQSVGTGLNHSLLVARQDGSEVCIANEHNGGVGVLGFLHGATLARPIYIYPGDALRIRVSSIIAANTLTVNEQWVDLEFGEYIVV